MYWFHLCWFWERNSTVVAERGFSQFLWVEVKWSYSHIAHDILNKDRNSTVVAERGLPKMIIFIIFMVLEASRTGKLRERHKFENGRRTWFFKNDNFRNFRWCYKHLAQESREKGMNLKMVAERGSKKQIHYLPYGHGRTFGISLSFHQSNERGNLFFISTPWSGSTQRKEEGSISPWGCRLIWNLSSWANPSRKDAPTPVKWIGYRRKWKPR